MSPPPKPRAHGADLPPWFLNKVREIADGRKRDFGESGGALGKALAKAVGREKNWSHSAVSRFLTEATTTMEMAIAFSVLFEIPPPYFMPKSFDEALSMRQVRRRFEGNDVTPEQRRRLKLVDDAADAAESELEDQTRGVSSKDEGAPRGGRPGRATRRRSPTS